MKTMNQKPTIPNFVANWIERHTQPFYDYDYETEEEKRYYAMGDSIHFTVYSLFADYPETNTDVQLRKPINEWLNADRSNYFKLVDAVRYGYEIEEGDYYTLTIAGVYNLVKFEEGFEFVRNIPASQLTKQEILDFDANLLSLAKKII